MLFEEKTAQQRDVGSQINRRPYEQRLMTKTMFTLTEDITLAKLDLTTRQLNNKKICFRNKGYDYLPK